MGLEQGISRLIGAALSGSPPNAALGGFFAQLPKDFVSPDNPSAWTYRTITSTPTYVLSGLDGLVSATWQIDCHGNAPDDAIALAAQIDAALSGFHGTLPDDDHTSVQGIFNQGSNVDGFSDANRTYVRTLEYQIDYAS